MEIYPEGGSIRESGEIASGFFIRRGTYRQWFRTWITHGVSDEAPIMRRDTPWALTRGISHGGS